MSRSMLVVFLLMILIITSQFEWRQTESDVESSSRESPKQQHISKREEVIKEKIILSQEKNIQRLNELVGSLREQLHQCRGKNQTLNNTMRLFTENVIAQATADSLED